MKAAYLLLTILLFSYLPFFINFSSGSVSIIGDAERICVSAALEPYKDENGLTVNEDGTFYPGDRFHVNYDVVINGVDFDRVEFLVPQWFTKISSSNWGALQGSALYSINHACPPGKYVIDIAAWGTYHFSSPEDVIEATYGGGSIVAYYQRTVISEPLNNTNGNVTSTFLPASAMASQPQIKLLSASTPRLEIKNFKWSSWIDLFRGRVARATGILTANGSPVNTEVTVEFMKRNIITGASYVTMKNVIAQDGYFECEDTCGLFEVFIDAAAWAQKDGYLPSWNIKLHAPTDIYELPRGQAFTVKIYVNVTGRLTPVNTILQALDLPSGITASIKKSGDDGFYLTLIAGENVPEGLYNIRLAATASGNYVEAPFTFKVTSLPVAYSTYTFSAVGINPQANPLTVDGSPYGVSASFNWKRGTLHSYSWASTVTGESWIENTTRYTAIYTLTNVEAAIYYVSKAELQVDVVKYDPHFTLTLAYVMPKEPGASSYEKPFAMILRYDGNGPDYNIKQRAVIDSIAYDGYMTKFISQNGSAAAPQNAAPFSLEGTPEEIAAMIGMNTTSFFQTIMDRKIEFAALGYIYTNASLKIDGELVDMNKLPVSYNWSDGDHYYEWPARMPVAVKTPQGINVLPNQWYAFEYCSVMFDDTYNFANTLNGSIDSPLFKKNTSPVGNVTVKGFGNKVLAIYSYNMKFDVLKEKYNEILTCNTTFPVIMNRENRYVKFIFQLSPEVASYASHVFNYSISYAISFVNKRFGSHSFQANFNCSFEYYNKQLNITAFKWNGNDWSIDDSAAIEAFFTSAFTLTESDLFMDYIHENTDDPVALEMASGDMYKAIPQVYFNQGSINSMLTRTSPYYYNIYVTAGRGYETVGVLPKVNDEWTDYVMSPYAHWTSTTSSISTSPTRTAGKYSIQVSSSTVAYAVLQLHLPLKGTLSQFISNTSFLSFDVYISDGCSQKLSVKLFSSTNEVTANTTLSELNKWITIKIPFQGEVSAVSFYCDVVGDKGTFLIDNLKFENVPVWKWISNANVDGTVKMNFGTDAPYTLYINLDAKSPLPVNVTRDNEKNAMITVNATVYHAGIANISLYRVTEAPKDYAISELPINELKKELIATYNCTFPNTKNFNLTAFNMTNFYTGYDVTYESVLGFSGEKELLLIKDPSFTATAGYNETLVVVEAQNVWGTKFHTIISLQPYSKTLLELLIEEVMRYILLLVIAAIIISIAVYIIKRPR
ncbi:MAG: hypothetical protein NWF09_09315 [Candidatus Bathyarchaeota archaeon]|nr:hypothetical protein [Candidatus Bathyarchaeota archaeon]